MAENNITAPALQDEKLNGYYQTFLKELPSQEISYTPIEYETQTVDSISDQVSKYLRNYYDKSIAQRQKQTIQNNADLDVDAASRGMGASTWLTDAKNRQYQAEAADVAQLNSDYNATLAQNVYQQYQNYLANRLQVETTNTANQLEVDQWNAQARTALEALAYQRALEENARTGGGGGGGGRSGGGGGIPSGYSEYFVRNENGKVYRQLMSKAEVKERGRESNGLIVNVK